MSTATTYKCPECGREYTDLDPEDLAYFEKRGHCDADDCCPTCHGTGEIDVKTYGMLADCDVETVACPDCTPEWEPYIPDED
jgi:hypothetical protein